MAGEIHDGKKVTEINTLIRHHLSFNGWNAIVCSTLCKTSFILDGWSRTPTLRTKPIIPLIDLQALGPEISIARRKSSKASSSDRMRFEILLTRMKSTAIQCWVESKRHHDCTQLELRIQVGDVEEARWFGRAVTFSYSTCG